METLDFYQSAQIIAEDVLTQKWNITAAQDELKNARYKIHSIVMGTSDTFHFTAELPSGRIHRFKIKGGNIQHDVF
jgi:hypothetical protein